LICFGEITYWADWLPVRAGRLGTILGSLGQRNLCHRAACPGRIAADRHRPVGRAPSPSAAPPNQLFSQPLWSFWSMAAVLRRQSPRRRAAWPLVLRARRQKGRFCQKPRL